MLFPPLGSGDFARALRESIGICQDYNAAAGYAGRTRVEYVSKDMLQYFGGDFTVECMSGDYLYHTSRMIDLAGGDLASKRQARNRFERRHDPRVEDFRPEHLAPCLQLLHLWNLQSEHAPSSVLGSACIKRAREVQAVDEAMRFNRELDLTGMVLYAGDRLAGFTFGELLDDDKTCSIVIEKTDRELTGAANYIFSEFCRRHFAATQFCNVGDDWDIPSLAWTKQSYRPLLRLEKFVVLPKARASAAFWRQADTPAACDAERTVQALPRAALSDLNELVELEGQCFSSPVAFSRRQWRYLLRCPRASTHVVREGGKVVGEGVLLRRRTHCGVIGRLYSMAVDPGHRGRGIGRMLLANCLDVLRAEGVRTVYLEVAKNNVPAIRLYESFGFLRLKTLTDYYGSGGDGWKMVVRLNDPARIVTAQHEATAAEQM